MEACKCLQEWVPGGTMDTEAWAQKAASDTKPNWDFNTEGGRAAIQLHQEALLCRVREGVRKPTNMSKTSPVTQKPSEAPGDLYKWLCEALQVFTPFDPKVPENQHIVNAAFVAQSTSDTCRKLQNLEVFAGINATQLLDVSNKVFVSQDRRGYKKKNRQAR